MSSEVLRAAIFAIAVVALIAQFVYDLVQRGEKKRANDDLRATVARLNSAVDRIESNLSQLVAEGRITKEEAQRVLTASMEERLNFQESLNADLIRKPE